MAQKPGSQQNNHAGRDVPKVAAAVPGPKVVPANIPAKPGTGASPGTPSAKAPQNGIKSTSGTPGSKPSPISVTPKSGSGATPGTQSAKAQQNGVKNTAGTPGSKASPSGVTPKAGTGATPVTQSPKAQQSKHHSGVASSKAGNQTPSPKPASASPPGPKSGASGPGLSGSNWATAPVAQKNHPGTNGLRAANATPNSKPTTAGASGPKSNTPNSGLSGSSWATAATSGTPQKNHAGTVNSNAANAAPSPKPNTVNVSGDKSAVSGSGLFDSKWATSANDQNSPVTPANKKLSSQAVPISKPVNKPVTTGPPQLKRSANLLQPLPQTLTPEKDDTPKATPPPEGELINISSSPESTDELTSKFNNMSLMSPGTEELQGLDFRPKFSNPTSSFNFERPNSVSPLFHPEKKIDFTEFIPGKAEHGHDVNPEVWLVTQSNTVIDGYTQELADLENFLQTKTCSDVMRAMMEPHMEELKVKIRDALQDAELARLDRDKENRDLIMTDVMSDPDATPRQIVKAKTNAKASPASTPTFVPIYGDHLLPGRRRQVCRSEK